MKTFALETGKSGVILLARFLLALLFLIFGWNKLTGFHGAITYMQATGAPVPVISALIATIVELLGGLFVLLGIFTRPIAVLFALYAIVTAYIGHPYWTMTGLPQFEAEINFYKNVAIAGGFLLLYVTGSGRFAVDALINRR
ncbi:MAG TPA: DoxX family protein [Acidocella sp.]|jgi:putative oxidoreductase|nr:DoxX family protein [Acidocella sp.]